MTEKRLIDWVTLWAVTNSCADCELARQCSIDEYVSRNLCPIWAKLELPPDNVDSNTEALIALSGRLQHERDEITKRRAEVQESCERWRSKCYDLEEQIEILKQRTKK